jgi:hypothetical protein
MRMAPTSVAAVGLALTSLCLAVWVSEIDLAPDWRWLRLPLILGLGLCALASTFLFFFLIPRRRQGLLRRTLSVMIGSLVVGAVVLVSTLEVSSILGGRVLRETLHEAGSGRWLYVYEYSEIPDGFERTSVMERSGILPVMHEVASVPYQVQEVRRDGSSAEIAFYFLEDEDGVPVRRNGAIRYDFETGKHEVVMAHGRE